MVLPVGFEPTRPEGRHTPNVACLPFSPREHQGGAATDRERQPVAARLDQAKGAASASPPSCIVSDEVADSDLRSVSAASFCGDWSPRRSFGRLRPRNHQHGRPFHFTDSKSPPRLDSTEPRLRWGLAPPTRAPYLGRTRTSSREPIGCPASFKALRAPSSIVTRCRGMATSGSSGGLDDGGALLSPGRRASCSHVLLRIWSSRKSGLSVSSNSRSRIRCSRDRMVSVAVMVPLNFQVPIAAWGTMPSILASRQPTNGGR